MFTVSVMGAVQDRQPRLIIIKYQMLTTIDIHVVPETLCVTMGKGVMGFELHTRIEPVLAGDLEAAECSYKVDAVQPVLKRQLVPQLQHLFTPGMIPGL